MYQREAPSVLKALLQEISENYLGVAPIRSGDSVIIDERSVQRLYKQRRHAINIWQVKCRSWFSSFCAGKQGGTALIRPMHYRKCSVWDFFMHGPRCTP